MNLNELLATYDLNHSLLIGYYGGGNYGDELLMEVLCNRLQAAGVKNATVMYQTPATAAVFHHDFGYALVPAFDKKRLIGAISAQKNIIVGGGGLWGLDVNFNVFMLSLMLLSARRLFGKRVFLLGVGYYGSTNFLGRISAWLAAKSATYIIARDNETFANFRRLTKHVGQDVDIAWSMRNIDLGAYESDAHRLEKKLHIFRQSLLITLRRFKANRANNYQNLIADLVAANGRRDIIIALMEPKAVDPQGYQFAQNLARKYEHVTVVDFSYNPIALYLLFKKYQKKLAVIAPQFHTILTAHLAGVPFLPISYDNKVVELYKQIGQLDFFSLDKLTLDTLQQFTDSAYGAKG